MSNIFYWKLAGTNIKKNKKTYVPFMITCAATIMMFYMMCYLKGIDGLEQLQGSEAIIMIMQFGVIVIGVFAAIFLFYTNSFLMKRRKKEFGLYNILGMEKLHLARVIGLETLYVWAFTLLVGLGLGILFSKLMSLLLFKLLTFELPFGFSVSTEGLVNSLILFSGIFLMIFLNNIRQIHLAKPVELLSGGAVGEREPKVKWILTAVGLISLSVGYIIAITTKAPVEAIPLFFVAVILVIIGTYCLFIAGSIALLKLLKKNKKYYYQTKNFTAISGMLYRMKQNAVGLANICILSTMVLVMLSTTLSLYLGIEDALRIQNPRNISVEAFDLSLQERASLTEEIDALIQQKGVNKKDELNYISTMKMMQRDGEKITLTEKNVYNATNIEIGFFISQDEYNFMKNENLQLKENETRIYSLGEKFHEKEINLEGTRYVVGEEVLDLPVAPGYYASISDIYFFIMPNDAPVLKQQSLL
ncbi:MAG: FtsX-like permease family protein, partial [Anaerovoracaceae bacterium]